MSVCQAHSCVSNTCQCVTTVLRTISNKNDTTHLLSQTIQCRQVVSRLIKDSDVISYRLSLVETQRTDNFELVGCFYLLQQALGIRENSFSLFT